MVTVLSKGTTNMLIITFRHYFQLSSIIFFLLQTRYITEYKNHSTFGILHAGTTCELKWRSKSDFFLLVLEQMLVVEWKSFFFFFTHWDFLGNKLKTKMKTYIYIYKAYKWERKSESSVCVSFIFETDLLHFISHLLNSTYVIQWWF